HPEWKGREERQRSAVFVLAEGEALLHRERDVSVEEVEGIVKRLVKIPPESPRHEIGISGVRAVIAHVENPRPRHGGGQAEEREEQEKLEEKAAQTLGHARRFYFPA